MEPTQPAEWNGAEWCFTASFPPIRKLLYKYPLKFLTVNNLSHIWFNHLRAISSMVERPLRMREARGSIPRLSTFFLFRKVLNTPTEFQFGGYPARAAMVTFCSGRNSRAPTPTRAERRLVSRGRRTCPSSRQALTPLRGGRRWDSNSRDRFTPTFASAPRTGGPRGASRISSTARGYYQGNPPRVQDDLGGPPRRGVGTEQSSRVLFFYLTEFTNFSKIHLVHQDSKRRNLSSQWGSKWGSILKLHFR